MPAVMAAIQLTYSATWPNLDFLTRAATRKCSSSCGTSVCASFAALNKDLGTPPSPRTCKSTRNLRFPYLLYRYSATDHTKFDQSLKHCPLGAVCCNCMPINDTADTCWAVKSPILYKVKSWGKIETAHKSEQVCNFCRCMTRCLPLSRNLLIRALYDKGIRLPSKF